MYIYKYTSMQWADPIWKCIIMTTRKREPQCETLKMNKCVVITRSTMVAADISWYIYSLMGLSSIEQLIAGSWPGPACTYFANIKVWRVAVYVNYKCLWVYVTLDEYSYTQTFWNDVDSVLTNLRFKACKTWIYSQGQPVGRVCPKQNR